MDEPIVIIPPSPTDDIIDDIGDTADDIDELSEQLAMHQIISEERHDEILERVNECLTRVDTLSMNSTAENPLYTQVLATLAELRAELSSLKLSVESIPKTPIPSVSIPLTPPPESESEVGRPEVEIETPEEQPVPLTEKPRKNRFI